MNWEAISAVSETIGAVAVVVSLIYLAIQVRSSSMATRASVHLGLHDSEAQLYALLLSDPKLRELFDQVISGDPKLSDVDSSYLSHFLMMRFNKYELFFFLDRERMFSSDVERAMITTVSTRLRNPVIKAWWDVSQDHFSADFIEWVNKNCTA